MTESTADLLATDRLLSALAARVPVPGGDPAVEALAALAAEVDSTPVPQVDVPAVEAPARSTPIPLVRRVGVATVAAGVLAVSSSGLAAAVTGDPLLPLRYVMTQLYDYGHPGDPDPRQVQDGRAATDERPSAGAAAFSTGPTGMEPGAYADPGDARRTTDGRDGASGESAPDLTEGSVASVDPSDIAVMDPDAVPADELVEEPPADQAADPVESAPSTPEPSAPPEDDGGAPAAPDPTAPAPSGSEEPEGDVLVDPAPDESPSSTPNGHGGGRPTGDDRPGEDPTRGRPDDPGTTAPSKPQTAPAGSVPDRRPTGDEVIEEPVEGTASP